MSKKSILIRNLWQKRGPHNIKYSSRPQSDQKNDSIDNKGLYSNIKLRLNDLSEVLVALYDLYCKNSNLYGDEFLAFIGDKVIRHWPWKDFPFTSEEAQKLLGYNKITGLTKNDTPVKKIKHITSNLRYEHWTPISFFRDVFIIAKDKKIKLTKKDFYDLLIDNYRVVWITQEEDNKLQHNNKTNRTKKTYTKLGIHISEKKLWNSFYGK